MRLPPQCLRINRREFLNTRKKFTRPDLVNFTRSGLVNLVDEKGAAMLATVLAVILILLAVGLSMISSGIFEGFMSQTQRDSREAFSAAQSGIQDAMLRVARNKNFSHAGYFIPAGCTLNGAAACVRVVVEKDAASACSQTISAGQDCLIATGTIENTTRKSEVILSVNATNGTINQVSWKEL